MKKMNVNITIIALEQYKERRIARESEAKTIKISLMLPALLQKVSQRKVKKMNEENECQYHQRLRILKRDRSREIEKSEQIQ